MRSSIAKKLTNVSTLYYLFVLEKHFPDDRKKIKQKQNKNVHKLMKRAYEIPFYRKRFDACHLTPDDFHCSEDLQKFPVPVSYTHLFRFRNLLTARSFAALNTVGMEPPMRAA